MRRFLKWVVTALNNGTKRLADVLWRPRPTYCKAAPLLAKLLRFGTMGAVLTLAVDSCVAKF